jgi:hypothetical protein
MKTLGCIGHRGLEAGLRHRSGQRDETRIRYHASSPRAQKRTPCIIVIWKNCVINFVSSFFFIVLLLQKEANLKESKLYLLSDL